MGKVITNKLYSLQIGTKSLKLKNKEMHKHMETYETKMKLVTYNHKYKETKHFETKIDTIK